MRAEYKSFPNSTATTATPESATQSCFGITWPRVFLIASAISLVLVFLGAISNFITVSLDVSAIILNVYVMLFACLAFSAELRQFDRLRHIVFRWLKFVYFLTSYLGRACFYILTGTLLLGSSALLYVAAAVTIVLGLLMLVIPLIVPMPTYFDGEIAQVEKQAVQEQQESNARQLGEAFFGPTRKE